MTSHYLTPWRVLVTGSRDFADAEMVHTALRHQADLFAGMVIVVGDCKSGADRFAREFRSNPPPEVHRANWRMFKRAAGPLRNKEMVESNIDICLAFFKSDSANIGTQNCVNLAKAKGIPVVEFTEGRAGVVGPGSTLVTVPPPAGRARPSTPSP